MTDTESDFIKQSREYFLGATKEGFVIWMEDNYSSIIFVNIPDAIQNEFWNEYLDDLEFARNAEIEKERTKRREL